MTHPTKNAIISDERRPLWRRNPRDPSPRTEMKMPIAKPVQIQNFTVLMSVLRS